MTKDGPRTFTLILPTTAGPVTCVDFESHRQPAHSLVHISGRTDTLPLSAAYDAFVKGPIGPLLGDGEWHYRVELDAEIETGRSWEVPFFLLHALHARGFSVAMKGRRPDFAIWTTGVLEANARVGLEEQTLQKADLFLASKADKSLGLLSKLKDDGVPLLVLLPELDGADAAERLLQTVLDHDRSEVVRFLKIRTALDAVARFRGKGGGTAAVATAPTPDPHAPVESDARTEAGARPAVESAAPSASSSAVPGRRAFGKAASLAALLVALGTISAVYGLPTWLTPPVGNQAAPTVETVAPPPSPPAPSEPDTGAGVSGGEPEAPPGTASEPAAPLPSIVELRPLDGYDCVDAVTEESRMRTVAVSISAETTVATPGPLCAVRFSSGTAAALHVTVDPPNDRMPFRRLADGILEYRFPSDTARLRRTVFHLAVPKTDGGSLAYDYTVQP